MDARKDAHLTANTPGTAACVLVLQQRSHVVEASQEQVYEEGESNATVLHHHLDLQMLRARFLQPCAP
jgi:hypothetical protein